ncbi:MAG: 3-hydroxyisobutyrate dehydrogenase [Thermoleophilaceae bacterium]|nr:3-hydroxyisobutyrate dehydrogenase [Thermoleophilaceae bacterium]MEA2470948.1 3-hydroxyisobutyrate dehydrogenase [Thermoleophilaceae bacterium]
MGAPMAQNLASAGLDVRVWNRTFERAGSVEGATAFEAAAEAVSGADLVLTMLADGEAVEETVAELDFGEAIWLQMSTVGIAATERLMAIAGSTPFVDAPVVGTKQPAEKGELTILASGPPDARSEAKPVFDALGARTIELGEAGEGTRLKLVINSWLVLMVEALAETMAFSEAIGVDPARFLETIEGGPTGPPYAQLKGKMMMARKFDPAFSLALARKDAALVLEAAERHGFDAPLVEIVVRKMDEAIAAGHGDEDMAATYLASAPDQ